MRQILRTYNLELKVQGPVFVGSGEEIQKKEYVFLNGRHALGVVDIQKLYQLAKKKGLASDMERFMVRDTRTTLRQWSDSHRIKPDELKTCMKYIVDAGDMQQEKAQCGSWPVSKTLTASLTSQAVLLRACCERSFLGRR